MALAEFKALCHDITWFLEGISEFAAKSHGNLSEILMAQDYQDLTGQVIRRVIDVVQEVENKLVDLIRLSGGKLGSINKLKNGIEAEGPQIKPTANAQVVANQDDVDDLLSSLGF
jgi:chemotaxis protein CheZ